MTHELRELLTQYGILSVSFSQLKAERPGSECESLEEYYRTLGSPLPDEPCLVVRISKDREFRFLKENEHDVSLRDENGKETGRVTVWELPEDEFWYFRAFRTGLFSLTKDLPGYLYQLGVVHAYALFEGYLSQILHHLMHRHPQLMGGQRQLTYEQLFKAKTKEELVDQLIDREIRDLMYLSIADILDKLRDRFGLRHLTKERDADITYLSLVRNCLLHNQARVDAKLAAHRPTFKMNETLPISMHDVDQAVEVLRDFASQIDLAYEGLIQ